MHTTHEQAAVFVPHTLADPADFAGTAAPCLEHVEAAGYGFAGIVRRWADAVAMLRDGRAHVVVVADRAHLPPDRRPRVEVAGDPLAHPPPTAAGCSVPADAVVPRQRRARRVR